MSEYEYKKVEDMSVGQVVDAMLDGEQFYNNGNGQEQRFNFEHIDIFTLLNWLNKGCVYTRTEKPWWTGCEGMPVMTCLGMAILDKYVDGKTPFYTNLGRFNNARLLTSAERDNIKTRD